MDGSRRALTRALEVAEEHIGEGSTDIPLIVMYTDGKPEGGLETNFVTDREQIKGSVRSKNSGRCIPLYSIAIGEDADFSFVHDLSQDSCGRAYRFQTDSQLIDNMESIFEEIRVPISYSIPQITVKSQCVDEQRLQNDLLALSGKKFDNTSDFELISIPFLETVSLRQPCEVELTYTAIVQNRPIKEEIKLCFPEGRKAQRRFQKLTDITKPCSRRIRGPPVKIPRGDYLERLREYREITQSAKEVEESNGDREALVERAKEAHFVVEDVTALVVVVQSDNDQCSPYRQVEVIRPVSHSRTSESITRPVPFENIPNENGDEKGTLTDAPCSLKACDKSEFRGSCVTVAASELPKLGTDQFTLGPDTIASLEISQTFSDDNCPGYVLYTEEEFQGDSTTFFPGRYSGFRELGIVYQETRSIRIL